MVKYFIICLCIWQSSKVSGQTPRPCGKPVLDFTAQEKAELYIANTSQPQAVTRLVRVYFHIFKNDDGTNPAATLVQIQNEFSQLQADYSANSLCFANMGVDSINSTQINTMLNPDVPSNVAWLNPFLIPDCINIFYHAGLVNYGGNAYSIPNTFCSIDKNNINFWRTISHEVGHCLGLSHTFETANGLENINGSNCTTTGDRVCDTPADPWSFRGSNPCFSNTGCTYSGTCTDGNGMNTYMPPFTNIMSYWGAVGCNLTILTPGQYSRANGFLGSNAGLLATQSPLSYYYGPVNINSGFEMKSAIFFFSTTGSVIFSGSVRSTLQGRLIQLNPGFKASPSSGKITIRPANCSY